MSEITTDNPQITMGQVFSKAWELTQKHSGVWLRMALLYIVPSIILSVIVGLAFDIDTESIANISSLDSAGTNNYSGFLLGVILVAFFQIVVTSIFVKVAVESAHGHNVGDFSKALETGKSTLSKVLLATLAVIAVVAAGFVLLFIPGLIAIFLLSMTVYIAADSELTITESMKLSFEYVKKFAGAILIFILCAIGISIASGFVSGIFGSLPGIISSIITVSINGAVQVFLSIAGAVLYVEIKKRYVAEKN